MNKSYEELIQLDSYEERLAYLQLFDNNVKSPRHMSGPFYHSNAWRIVRRQIINRDLGFDLGVFGVYIEGNMYVHHINPITEDDIIYHTSKLLDPNNLITVSDKTHNLIHYRNKVRDEWVDRKPGDTILW